MRKFKFRLESVLRYASREEQRLTLELAQIQIEKERELSQLEYLAAEREKSRRKLMVPAGTTLDMEKVEIIRRHLEALAEKIAAQHEIIAKLEVAIEQKTGELIEAMKKRKTLEKLREREKHEHNLILSRMEEKMLDDLTTPRHALRTN